MAYKVIILYRLYMPSYVLGTFTEYPFLNKKDIQASSKAPIFLSVITVFLPESFSFHTP